MVSFAKLCHLNKITGLYIIKEKTLFFTCTFEESIILQKYPSAMSRSVLFQMEDNISSNCDYDTN